MGDFLIGVAGSLAATVVWVLATYFLSRHFRDRLIRFVLRMLDAGIEFVYPRQSAAEGAIVEELRKGEEIKILNLRGRSLAEGYLSCLLQERPFRKVKLLLADPETPNSCNPLVYRAQELQKTEVTMSPNLFVDEGRATLRLIYDLNRNNLLEIKVYQFPAVFRLFATENTMFISYYPNIGRAREATVYRLRSGSPLFLMFWKYFDRIWSDPRTREPNERKDSQE